MGGPRPDRAQPGQGHLPSAAAAAPPLRRGGGPRGRAVAAAVPPRRPLARCRGVTGEGLPGRASVAFLGTGVPRPVCETGEPGQAAGAAANSVRVAVGKAGGRMVGGLLRLSLVNQASSAGPQLPGPTEGRTGRALSHPAKETLRRRTELLWGEGSSPRGALESDPG